MGFMSRIKMTSVVLLLAWIGSISSLANPLPEPFYETSLEILTRLYAPGLVETKTDLPREGLFCGVEIQAMVAETWSTMTPALRQKIPDLFRPREFQELGPNRYRGNEVCDASLDSEHFRIHYSTDPQHLPPGYPDLQTVRDLATHLETAYVYHRDVSGMGVPLADGDFGGGQDLIDCYFYDLDDLFGWAHGEEWVEGPCENTYWGFMAISTDFGFEDYDNQLKLTSEHEYYHLLQYSINGSQYYWFLESTARNSEFHVWPKIAAPRGAFEWMAHPYYPMWFGAGIRKYAPHFWFYLEAGHGWDFVDRLWDRCCHLRGEEALVEELESVGTDLDAALTEFAIWNYFAGERDDGEHYDPDLQVPAVYHQAGHSQFPVVPTYLPEEKIAQPSGSNYIRFRGPASANDLKLTFNGQPEMAQERAVIVLGVSDWGHRTWVLEPDLDGDVELIVPDWGLYEFVTLAVVNFWDAPADPDSLHYTYAAEELDQAAGPTASAQLVMGVPNPFHQSTQIVFYAPTDNVISTIRVYDTAGRLVRTLLDGAVYSGRHQVRWDGKDQNGQQVATGLYFVRLESGQDRYTRKVMFVR